MPERDLAVLYSVATHRFLTTRHITALHFADTSQDEHGSRMARKVLKRLQDSGVISHLEQRIGGVRAGSASFVWRVGPVGDRLLRFGTEDTVRRGRPYEPSEWLLKHCLAIADVHVELLGAARAGRFELLRADLEPATWRHYLGLGGERRVLKPDLAAVTASGDYEDHWFVEVDLGHEHIPTILDKCRTYELYRRTGTEEEHRGQSVFPVVVWVMHTPERAERLRDAIDGTRSLDAGLFRVTTHHALADLIEGGAA
jgi:hypothetical protein